MGIFLSLTSVVGKTQNEVVSSFEKYALSVKGGLAKEKLPVDHENFCLIEEAEGNTTILYPNAYLDWDDASQFISTDLNTPVFSFDIYDGDLWMYVFFVNGQLTDQFNPIPSYWEEISEEEQNAWRGNAAAIVKHLTSVRAQDIENYLQWWDLNDDESKKAYPDDEFGQEDWQLLDFMKKLKLPYPFDKDGNPKGSVYKLWTKGLPLNTEVNLAPSPAPVSRDEVDKPWWKFW
jgi:hypothetical protein